LNCFGGVICDACLPHGLRRSDGRRSGRLGFRHPLRPELRRVGSGRTQDRSRRDPGPRPRPGGRTKGLGRGSGRTYTRPNEYRWSAGPWRCEASGHRVRPAEDRVAPIHLNSVSHEGALHVREARNPLSTVAGVGLSSRQHGWTP